MMKGGKITVSSRFALTSLSGVKSKARLGLRARKELE